MTLKVLIVDDCELIRSLVREMLETMPSVTAIQEAADTLDAVTVLTAWQPDVVTLDLQLPGGTGLDVLRAISRSGLSPIVIVITSLSDEQTRAACHAAGAHFFLDKAFEMDKLQSLVIEAAQARHDTGDPYRVRNAMAGRADCRSFYL